MSDFKIGDLVIVTDKHDIGAFRGQTGKIIFLDNPEGEYGDYCLIEFFNNDFYPDLHNGDGFGPYDKCWWIRPYFLKKIDENDIKRRRKIENPEIDPFGEEIWGYVQESIDNVKSLNIYDKFREFDRNISRTVEFLKKELIGKLVAFKIFEGPIVSRVIIDIKQELYYYFKCENVFFKVDLRFPITYRENNRKKIENPEVDPFGEEEWGYVQEKKEEDIYILVTPKLREWMKREAWNMEPFIGKTFKVKGTDTYQGGCYMLDFESMKKNGIEYWNADWYIPYDSAEIVNMIGKKKLKKPEIDPFGEEEWGYVQEYYKFKFKVGDVVTIGNHHKDNFIGKTGKIIFISNGNYLVEFKKRFYDQLHNAEHIVKNNGNCWFFRMEVFELPDKIKKKKIENPEVDPFGEEEWGYVQENLNDGIRSYTLWQKYSKFSNQHNGVGSISGQLINFLKKDLIGKTVQFKDVIDREIYSNEIIDVGYDYSKGFKFITKNKKTHYINIDYPIKYIVGKRIKNPDVDPFDEENWGYIQENADDKTIGIEDLVNYNMTFKNVEEMEEVAKILSQYYEVHNIDIILGDDPDRYYNMSWDHKDNWKYFKYSSILGGLKKFSRSSGKPAELLSINLEMLRKITSGGLKKKIRNPEIDPFGEENWGYVQEKLEIGTFNVGDEVKLIGLIKDGDEDEDDAEKNSTERGRIVDIDLSDKYPIEVRWGNDMKFSYKLEELEIYSHRKRVDNIEIDPFGEEIWFE